jgi:hypothetical protein
MRIRRLSVVFTALAADTQHPKQICVTFGEMGGGRQTTRRRATAGWIVVTMLYSVLRIGLARTFLDEYGLNIAVFAVVELVASAIWAISSARLAIALVDRRNERLIIPAGLAAIGFFAPDAYIIVGARSAPVGLLVAVLVWTAVAAVVSWWRLSGRRPHASRASHESVV